MTRPFLLPKTRGSDSGFALVPVLGFAITISLLLGVAAHQGTLTLKLSRRTQDVNAALQAANGAVQEYLSRINNDPTYTKYAHVPASNCAGAPSTPTLDPANPFMGSVMTPLPGGPADTAIRYSIDASKLCTSGVVLVTAFGRSQQIERKMTYTVKQRSFLDYAYFSEFETLNPAKYPNTHAWVISGELDWRCDRHHQDPSKPHPSTGQVLAPTREWSGADECAMINWMTKDYVEGAVHTNDALLVCGYPHFAGKVTTSWQGDGTRRHLANPGCRNNPNFKNNWENKYCKQDSFDDACYEAPLQMPVGTTALKSNPNACVYTGPTKIEINGNNMRVTSPNTPAGAGCGTGWVPVRQNGIVYVQTVPAGTAEVPCTTPAGWVNPQNPVGYPEYATDITSYDCRAGDLFITGGGYDVTTYVAENRVVFTGALRYWREGASVLNGVRGIIAGTDAEIYHPVGLDTDGVYQNLHPKVHDINAGILALNGSFLVQNYDKGAALGQMYMFGAITQKWRGLVGTTDNAHGYTKSYFHDPVLRHRLPPHFLPAPNAPWHVVMATP